MAYLQDNEQAYFQDTWTPEITGSSSNPTVAYTSRSGHYTQFGNLIMCKADLQISSTSGGSGDIRISLPFTSANVAGSETGIIFIENVTLSDAQYLVENPINTNYVTILGINDNTTANTLQISSLTSTTNLVFHIHYMIN